MLLIMIVCMLLRGPASKPSMIGVERCDALDFVFLGIIFIAAIIFTFISVKITALEYNQKCDAGYKFVAGDVEFTPISTFKLLCFAFFGAFAATAVGMGPGSIFTPIMVVLDMHPAVASSTGMYLTMFTAGAATINLFIF